MKALPTSSTRTSFSWPSWIYARSGRATRSSYRGSTSIISTPCEGVITPILRLWQGLAAAMKALYGVPRVGFLFTGGDLPHAHAHVVPLHEKEDITSQQYIAERGLTFREAPRMPDPELAAVARDLVRALGQQN